MKKRVSYEVEVRTLGSETIIGGTMKDCHCDKDSDTGSRSVERRKTIQLKQKVDELETAMCVRGGDLLEMQRIARKEQSKKEELRKALEKYGLHDYDCPVNRMNGEKCKCGLDEALKEVSKDLHYGGKGCRRGYTLCLENSDTMSLLEWTNNKENVTCAKCIEALKET